MDVIKVLRMNRGEGETSYAKNSNVQRTIISATSSRLKEALINILCKNKKVPESIGIADLGCSFGPNALMAVTEIIDIIDVTCRNLGSSFPEIRIYLNDLPGNDFNDIFSSLPKFFHKLKVEKDRCHVAGVAGSFYGRLFPLRSLHFVNSSSSLHWLSQVPPGLDSLNKGKLYISKTSPTKVINAYMLQFHKDFSSFLQSRSPEMVPGGRMLLSLMGRTSYDPTTEENCYQQWELLALALSKLISKGLVEEEKIDSFNVPFFSPSLEEVKFAVVDEGSFIINRIEVFEVEWDACASSLNSSPTCEGDQHHQLLEKSPSKGQHVANTIRAVAESMLESHFGNEIMDDLFKEYSDLVDDYLSKKRAVVINLVVSLTRKE